jgi:hypothetical protein
MTNWRFQRSFAGKPPDRSGGYGPLFIDSQTDFTPNHKRLNARMKFFRLVQSKQLFEGLSRRREQVFFGRGGAPVGPHEGNSW